MSGVILFPGQGHGNSSGCTSLLQHSFHEPSSGVFGDHHGRYSFLAVGAARSHDQFDRSRDKPIHDRSTDNLVRENREPVFGWAVGRDHNGAFLEALVGERVQKLGFLLAIEPKGKIIENEKSGGDASLQEYLTALRRETVGYEMFEELVGLEDNDIESTTCGFMAHRVGDV